MLPVAVISHSALSRQVPSSIRLSIAALDTMCYPNCAHPTEWKATLVAELVDSAGTVIPPNAQLFYEWGVDFCGGRGFGWGFAGGNGLWILDVDGNKIKNSDGCCPSCPYQSYLIGVRVFAGGSYVTSPLTRVPDGGVEWRGGHVVAAPNPFDLTNASVLTLSLPVLDPTVQVSFLSLSGDLAFRREYTAIQYFGRWVVQMPASDFAETVTSGVYFVVAKTSLREFTLKIVFIRR
jgi:hypothetical protein